MAKQRNRPEIKCNQQMLYEILRLADFVFEGQPKMDAEERWIDTRPTRPSQKHEPMPKNFSPEDQFRAKGLGIRLD